MELEVAVLAESDFLFQFCGDPAFEGRDFSDSSLELGFEGIVFLFDLLLKANDFVFE